MTTEAVFDELVRRAYDAAGGEGWDAFLTCYARQLGARGGWLLHQSTDNGNVCVRASAGLDPSWVAAFRERYHRINPYAPAAARLSSGSWAYSHELVPRESVEEGAFFADFVQPQGLRAAAAFSILFSDPERTSRLTLHIGVDQRDDVLLGSAELQRRLLPHLRVALRLHEQLSELRGLSEDLRQALELTRIAALVCDAEGRVLLATRAAETLLARADGLRTEGLVLCGETRQGATLQSLLARSLPSDGGASGRWASAEPVEVACIARPSGAADYQLLIAPLPSRQEEPRPARPRALVFVSDPSQGPARDPLRRLYGLTEREAQVAELLCRGLSSGAVSESLGIGRETLKSHLRSLFAKTRTSRRAETVAVLLSGGSVLRHR